MLTGSYNYVGWQNNLVIIVNKDNPITRITMKQLDGVFGSVRDGGWVGSTWHPEFSRGPEGDIRKWGQLGLTGEWADKPIGVHGYSLRYATTIEFSNKVLQASDKWNGDLHAYAITQAQRYHLPRGGPDFRAVRRTPMRSATRAITTVSRRTSRSSPSRKPTKGPRRIQHRHAAEPHVSSGATSRSG